MQQYYTTSNKTPFVDYYFFFFFSFVRSFGRFSVDCKTNVRTNSGTKGNDEVTDTERSEKQKRVMSNRAQFSIRYLVSAGARAQDSHLFGLFRLTRSRSWCRRCIHKSVFVVQQKRRASKKKPSTDFGRGERINTSATTTAKQKKQKSSKNLWCKCGRVFACAYFAFQRLKCARIRSIPYWLLEAKSLSTLARQKQINCIEFGCLAVRKLTAVASSVVVVISRVILSSFLFSLVLRVFSGATNGNAATHVQWRQQRETAVSIITITHYTQFFNSIFYLTVANMRAMCSCASATASQ